MQKASSWVTIWPPITLGVLAAIAKQHGPVRLFDGNIEKTTMQQLLDDIGAFAPDLLVVNTGFPSIENDMSITALIKQRFPDIRVVAVGVYFTLLEEESLKAQAAVDFGIIGEPEATFDELLKCLQTKAADLSLIKGLAYRDAHGVRINKRRPLIEELDSIPRPARELFNNNAYRLPHNNRTFTLINSARGCPFTCTYCIVRPYYGSKVRRHSIDYIITEVKECVAKYNIQEFLFWEEVFSLDKQFVAELCKAFRDNELAIRWAATTRVDTLDESTLRLMKDSGCYLLGLGIESSSQTILDNAKKRQSIDDIRRAVALCKKVGLQTMGHFIFGLPGETRQTAQATINFMLELGLDFVQAYCAVPYPKTEFGDMARARGWVKESDWSKYDFGGDSIVRTEQLTPEEVTCFRKKAFRAFYYRPLFIIKKFFKNISIFQLLRITRFSEWMNAKD